MHHLESASARMSGEFAQASAEAMEGDFSANFGNSLM